MNLRVRHNFGPTLGGVPVGHPIYLETPVLKTLAIEMRFYDFANTFQFTAHGSMPFEGVRPTQEEIEAVVVKFAGENSPKGGAIVTARPILEMYAGCRVDVSAGVELRNTNGTFTMSLPVITPTDVTSQS